MPLPAISLSQFNRIATGKYNAGFVDFQTDDQGNLTGELTKVNNHVHATGKNKTELSPARVLEVKEAFIAAMERARVPCIPGRGPRIGPGSGGPAGARAA